MSGLVCCLRADPGRMVELNGRLEQKALAVIEHWGYCSDGQSMPDPDPIRCPFCVEGNHFKVMTEKEGLWFKCDLCGHLARPMSPPPKCRCTNCLALERPPSRGRGTLSTPVRTLLRSRPSHLVDKRGVRFAQQSGSANMNHLLRKLWGDDDGQDIAEYAVMLAVILVLVVGTIRLVGSNANTVFSNVASSIQ